MPVLIGTTTSGIQLARKAAVDSFFVPAYWDSNESPTRIGYRYFGIAGEDFQIHCYQVRGRYMFPEILSEEIETR
jgi:hypothetical protein